MKKIIFSFAIISLALSSCKNDSTETPVTATVYDAATQNKYDDQAAVKFLNDYFLDARGNIKPFTTTDVPSATNVKLADLNPVTLPSGVIYIMRAGAQPATGKVIGNTDVIRLLSNTLTYQATNINDVVTFNFPQTFRNGVSGTGVPEVDPTYFYVKNSVLAAATTDASKQRSYYQIEGFSEALQKFKAYDIPDSDNYTLQGVIIVPSRAAFGKDSHFNYTGFSLNDRSFVFDFQVYKTDTRPNP
ncbi:hypothetical protein [Halpernia frigidisoli]|uniref:Uncharacterized protein n=1 Tax=Halpernia frigidisoli TaxID=1125876 RepID=A0A1I3FBP1_9FLAO|nr:hypothetical protein [Halpernia frigidisoli]SFI08648.1 hypothetical protein SAMN05443292_1274 [Halpernia frigidisoli]